MLCNSSGTWIHLVCYCPDWSGSFSVTVQSALGHEGPFCTLEYLDQGLLQGKLNRTPQIKPLIAVVIFKNMNYKNKQKSIKTWCSYYFPPLMVYSDLDHITCCLVSGSCLSKPYRNTALIILLFFQQCSVKCLVSSLSMCVDMAG